MTTTQRQTIATNIAAILTLANELRWAKITGPNAADGISYHAKQIRNLIPNGNDPKAMRQIAEIVRESRKREA